MVKMKPDSVDELISLIRYRFPRWKILVNIGLRSRAGTHSGGGSGKVQFVKSPVEMFSNLLLPNLLSHPYRCH